MPAHKKAIDRTCPCGKPAGYEVFNTRNASVGHFCRRCAAKTIVSLNAADRPPKTAPGA